MMDNNVNVKDWMDLVTDPGFAVIAGFIALVMPVLIALFNPAAMMPIVHDVYPIFGPSVVGLITAHAWKDADKTKYLMEMNRQTQQVVQPAVDGTKAGDS